MTSKEKKINQLKKYFNKRSDVAAAFLFGSRSQAEGRESSDWDIAVYFFTENNRLEWEASDREYPAENKIWGDCVSLLKTDNVDILVLNRAPVSIGDTAIQGRPLVIKDWPLLMKFARVVSSAAEEYRRFVHEFYLITERSKSLADRDREDLEKTLNFLEEQAGLYEVYRGFTRAAFEKEPRKRNEMERWLENIVNAVIDSAKIVLASGKRLIPSTYRETVRLALSELKLSEEFMKNFEKWVQLRNVLAHEYLDIKWQRLAEFAQDSEAAIQKLSEALKKFLVEEEKNKKRQK